MVRHVRRTTVTKWNHQKIVLFLKLLIELPMELFECQPIESATENAELDARTVPFN
jgi:hypothetical protein